MFEKELVEQEEQTLAASRGRSPSDAASGGGSAGLTPAVPTAGHPQVVPPVAECRLIRCAGRGAD